MTRAASGLAKKKRPKRTHRVSGLNGGREAGFEKFKSKAQVLRLQLSGCEGLARLLFQQGFERAHVRFAPFAMP
jgi:hypothetical protein